MNTDIIANHMCSQLTDAARQCEQYVSNSYEDWFLPSINELELIWNRLGASGNLGNFVGSPYWSSTPGTDQGAWAINFNDGSSSPVLRADQSGATVRIRAVRSF
tara:strand:- start:707 stop:1018 length:312 start_codon:yes stop_codon:yes gene_type:complete